MLHLSLSDADIHQVLKNNKVKIEVFIMNYSLIIDTSMIVMATPSNHHRKQPELVNDNCSSISDDVWTWDLNKTAKHLCYLKNNKVKIKEL